MRSEKTKTLSFILILIVAIPIFNFSCISSKKTSLPNEKEVIIVLKNDLKKQMNAVYTKHPDAYKDTTEFNINYFPLIRKKDFTGIYNYSKIATHQSRKNFFTYDKNGVNILNTENLENLIQEVESFLNKNRFSDKQKKKCLEKINTLWNEDNTNSF